MDRVDLLDHGYVRLVDHMGGDLSISRAARVSYDAAWRAGEDEGSDARLIRYLWRNQHTTPFEAVTLTFEVHAPIFVFRQWHRHRTWSFNELSARYRELPEEFYVPEPAQIQGQSASNKQGRAEKLPHPVVEGTRAIMRRQCELAFEAYRAMLGQGVARELARSVLPVSTYSTMFATVDLLNLLKFLTLRTHPHAQYEIRVYAEAMRDLARSVAPVALQAWTEEGNQFGAPDPTETLWRPISELTPEHGEVLGWTEGCGYEVIRKAGDGHCYSGAFTADWVKCWQRIPGRAPPRMATPPPSWSSWRRRLHVPRRRGT